MSKKIQAAEAIEVLANQYRAMVEAAEMLKQIGSLDNATAEARKALEAAKDEAEAAKLEADLAKADAKKAKAKVVEILDKAKIDADEIIAAAVAQGAKEVGGAQMKADSIVAAAQARADALVADVENRRTAISRDVDRLVEQHESLALDIKAKTDEVADLEARLAKAQAQIAKLLG